MADQKKLVTERKEETKATDLGESTSLSAERDAVLDAWMNRPKFSYNVNEDALYQQYADTYKRGGRMAMLDTMGQAQTMTGGYGNSYAQSVGQQAYQGYMQQLNDVIPELYSLAYGMYNDEGERLAEKYQVLAGLEEQEYQRGIDKRDYNYKVSRDEKEDAWRQKEYDLTLDEQTYAREQDAYDKKLTEAQIAASLGDFSGYESLGYDTSNVGTLISDGESYSIKEYEEIQFFDRIADKDYQGAYQYLNTLLAKGVDENVIEQYMAFLPETFLDSLRPVEDTTVEPTADNAPAIVTGRGGGPGTGTGALGRIVREFK